MQWHDTSYVVQSVEQLFFMKKALLLTEMSLLYVIPIIAKASPFSFCYSQLMLLLFLLEQMAILLLLFHMIGLSSCGQVEIMKRKRLWMLTK